MNDTVRVAILSAMATALVMLMLVIISMNPWVSAGLAPILMGVAAIIRAIAGNDQSSDDGSST